MIYNLPSTMSGSGRLSVGFNDAHARVKITACSNPHYVGRKGVYAGSDISTNYYVVNENGVHNFTDSTPIPANTTVESRYSFAGCFQPWAGGDNPVSTKMFEYKGDLYLAFTMCINDFEGPVSSSWPQGETGPTDLTGHPHPPSMVLRMRWEDGALILINKVSLGINASTAVFVVDEYAGTLTIVYSEAAFPTQPVKTLTVNLSTLTLSSPTTLFSVSKTLCPTDAFDARNIVYTSGVLSYDENEPIVRITDSAVSNGMVELTFTVATPDSRKVAIIPYVAKREVLGETTAFTPLPPIYPVQTSVTGMEYSYSYPVTETKECYLQHKIVAVDSLGPHGNIDTYVVGNTVTFDATRSWCLESDIVEYKWNVGNYSANTPTNSYTFPTPTQRLIYLTLRDANGREQTTTSQLTLGTPTASFTTSINGLRVTFTPSGGTKYEWDIKGTGVWESANTFHFSHPQTAKVYLTVDDTYTTSQDVTVAYVMPTASMNISSISLDMDLTGSGGVGYLWTFDENIVGSFIIGSATTQFARFRCESQYIGPVTLTVTDEYGNTDTTTQNAYIAEEPPVANIAMSLVSNKLTLNGSSSGSPFGGAITYLWEFSPELTPAVATYSLGDPEKEKITVAFKSSYSGNVRLTVTDTYGSIGLNSRSVSYTHGAAVPVISYTQANDVLRLDASGSTGATTYTWSFSGTPNGYWVVGDANTRIAHFKFITDYTGTLTLTVNGGVFTDTPLTFNFGIPVGFAGRTATAYAPLIPLTVYPGFAAQVAYAFTINSTNITYATFASHPAAAFNPKLSPNVSPSAASRTATGYSPLLRTPLIPTPALRTPLAFGPALFITAYPAFASHPSTAYDVVINATVIPDFANNPATAYGVTLV